MYCPFKMKKLEVGLQTNPLLIQSHLVLPLPAVWKQQLVAGPDAELELEFPNLYCGPGFSTYQPGIVGSSGACFLICKIRKLLLIHMTLRHLYEDQRVNVLQK